MSVLKKPMALILLITVLPRLSIAQEPGELETVSASEYGIDLNAEYSGAEVAGVVRIVVEEAEAGINEAYAEGYKASLLEAAPDAAYYKSISASLRDELEAERQALKFSPAGVLVAGLLSFLTGGLSYALITR
jgi:hypothetical protein